MFVFVSHRNHAHQVACSAVHRRRRSTPRWCSEGRTRLATTQINVTTLRPLSLTSAIPDSNWLGKNQLLSLTSARLSVLDKFFCNSLKSIWKKNYNDLNHDGWKTRKKNSKNTLSAICWIPPLTRRRMPFGKFDTNCVSKRKWKAFSRGNGSLSAARISFAFIVVGLAAIHANGVTHTLRVAVVNKALPYFSPNVETMVDCGWARLSDCAAYSFPYRESTNWKMRVWDSVV